MIYLTTQLWPYMVVAFAFGCFIGWRRATTGH
jgi:hypothetical protein